MREDRNGRKGRGRGLFRKHTAGVSEDYPAPCNVTNIRNIAHKNPSRKTLLGHTVKGHMMFHEKNDPE